MPLITIEFPLAEIREAIFFLELALSDAEGIKLAQSRYVYTTAANLAPILLGASTELAITQEVVGDLWKLRLKNKGKHTARFIWLQDSCEVDANGYVYFSDHHFCLFPDESKEIQIRWSNIPIQERSLQISAWNCDEQIIS